MIVNEQNTRLYKNSAVCSMFDQYLQFFFAFRNVLRYVWIGVWIIHPAVHYVKPH